MLYLGRENSAPISAPAQTGDTLPAISKKIVKYIFIVSILATLLSCKQAEAPAEELPLPISTFDSPFPKNNKQLSRIFGKLLLVKNGSDTLFLKIASTKNDNLLTDGKTGDTIFFGKVCKFREFYYLNHKVNDTSYYISVFKIKDNLIYGLDRWYQYLDVDENIVNGNAKELVKSVNKDTSSIRLKPNKRELKKLFGLIMSKIKPDTILNSRIELNEIAKKELALENETDEIENDIKVYPNPASDFLNVKIKQKSSYQLIDMNGKIVLHGILAELENRIDISNKENGIYFLTVIDLQKKQKQTVKVIVK